ncbi:hypothetical protein K4K61_004683 [Colletotrichum sp. SAR11_59]|uniref:Uncharacterized protein n=3 Tax=Colletotrichum gloeosporioides species complex TaxID=2707338 RepID=T0LHE4_COLGC|nr:uncharacterized protein CGCS363_v009904 [Colletotrichum siamense]XP_045260086.1 uncharacterized protein GCG54_00010201 [Colletotrichum gloeosporioides]EQB47590.1 hypothetical protein CGLO_13241 [Colletotrichum gloeosporioides Cg-14]KAF0315989.1 hypothetical protein GQ607_016748 [Colletotrichum asianum]KAF4920921.1 hypothetical protein CGCVW01_v006448 [Colletotrichum viniferum]KAI8267441.1 hypothetical protein K4K58_007854 [Colletotrichum sp. SAR11_239]KAI8306250.1 hypothetical protein K4K6
MVTAFFVAFSAAFGMAEAIRHTQQTARRKEHRSRKNNLLIRCRKSTKYSPELEGKHVVLSGDKLFVDTGTDPDSAFGHQFAGYFLPYPEAQYAGLVSTICDEPPIMNWIYVDRDTYEVKFGTRPYAQHNYNGPFDCTRQDHRLTFASWEGFFVVENDGFWSLYFDVEQDGLKSKLGEGCLALEVDLVRVEMPVKPVKPEEKEEQAVGKTSGEEGKENNAKAGEPEVQLESPEVD